jgi:RND family efflux transporter MFP subunit
MNKLVSYAVTATVCLLVCIHFSSCNRHSHAAHADEPMTVDVANPVIDSVTVYKTYPGYLSAKLEIALVARVNGYLKRHPYKAGDLVRAGQLLFEIEDAKYRDAVEQAQASLATAQASYEYAQQEYEAMNKALLSDAVSQMEVIQAKSNMEQSAANISSALAALKTAQTTLGYCNVKAPIAGHISASIYDDGSYLGGETTPVKLATLYADSVMIAVFSIVDLGYLDILRQLANGDMADYSQMPITFSEELSHDYTANLSYIAPEIDKSTGTITLHALVDNPHGELKSGMYTMIKLPTRIDRRAMLVKDASIGTDQSGHYLYTIDASNKVNYTPIEVGELVNDTMRIVTGELDANARYVTKALLKVRTGVEVNPRLVK